MKASAFIYDLGGFKYFNIRTRKFYNLKNDLGSLIASARDNSKINSWLVKNYFVTECENYEDEIREFNNIKKIRNRNEITITFTVTTKCEQKCAYCFQNHTDRSSMDIDTINNLEKLLLNEIESNKELKIINLILFGGEPLLEKELCHELIDRVSKIKTNNNLIINTVLTTNGNVIDIDLFDKFKVFDTRAVQITFDGTEADHNKSRGGGSDSFFQEIVKKLKVYEQYFSVCIKYNFNKKNINQFSSLVDTIENNFAKKNHLYKLEALQTSLSYSDQDYFYHINDKSLSLAYLELAKICIDKGVYYDIESIFRPPCSVGAPYSLTVEPNGDLSSCVSAFSIPFFKIGNIRETDSLWIERDRFIPKINPDDVCVKTKCAFYPICETGCIYEKVVSGDDSIICRKKFYNEFIPELHSIREQSNEDDKLSY
ncbi:MAG: radical SAM protein [Oligoflexia bacterium]|nr:radical SAM protein [Oligoflexia bacterium]